MPCIAQIPGGIKIEMYPGDHPPPHFHSRHGGDVAKIRIADLTILKGSLPPATLQTVKAWVGQGNRQQALAFNWVLCETLQKPRNIP